MDASYKKDLRHNYLVLTKMDNSDDEDYCVCMLEANSIDGIIKPEPRTIDNRVLYYYDITSKQSIETIFVKNTISYEQLKEFFTNLLAIVEQAYEFLLNENDLLLEPEHIYIELTKGKANLAYLPGYNKDIGKQIVLLIEYLMNKVDYNDKEAVFYVYNLYAVCRDERFSFYNLISAIRENKSDNSIMVKGKKDRKDTKDSNICIKKDSIHDDAYNSDKQSSVKEEYSHRKQMPVMMEKVSEESEIYYYPLRTYIYTGACILGAIMVFVIFLNMKVIYTSIGNRIDYGKLMALLSILLIIVGYLIRIIWNKNNRSTKIISKQEYIDPRIDYSHKLNAESKSEQLKREYEYTLPKNKSEALDRSDNKSCSTVLLNADIPSCGCRLQPVDKDLFDAIDIGEFPFVIGKQENNVDYFLDKEEVSRYHVKVTKEEGNYYITDLNSTNGTILNDKSLSCYQRYKLTKGDKVSIAGINYLFQI